MSLTISNTPFDLADRLRSGWSWWVETLAGMLPASWTLGSGAAEVDILLGETTTIERVSDGIGVRYAESRSIENLDDEAWAELGALVEGAATRLVLTPPRTYVARLKLPKTAEAHARAAAALRIADLSPVNPDLVLHGMRIAAHDDRTVEAQIAFVLKRDLEAIEAAFAARGLPMPPVNARADDTTILIRKGHDFRLTPAVRKARGRWAGAIGMLAAVPLITLAASEAMIWRETEKADAAREAAAASLRAEQRFRTDAEAMKALSALAAMTPATIALDRLSSALPEEATVTAIEGDLRGLAAVDLTAPDPDQLAGNSALGDLRAEAQSREGEQYRIRLARSGG